MTSSGLMWRVKKDMPEGPITLTALAVKTGVDKGNLHRALDDMLKLELVIRIDDKSGIKWQKTRLI